VTVVCNSAEKASILAKYIFILGADEFLKTELSKTLKYIIVRSNGKVVASPRLAGENSLEILD
jgi:thiamine biosynthesis lipoprotein ApbE